MQEIAARGPAIATETWLVDEAGGNLRRIATHRLDDIELGRIDPQVSACRRPFAICGHASHPARRAIV